MAGIEITPEREGGDAVGAPEAAEEMRRVEQVRADIDALGEMIEGLLLEPRMSEDSVAMMAARSVLEQRYGELAQLQEVA